MAWRRAVTEQVNDGPVLQTDNLSKQFRIGSGLHRKSDRKSVV